ncbi:MAG: phage portal protein [Stackebrandtia sp.]
MALPGTEFPRDPDWWLIRLGKRLRERHDRKLVPWWDYYRGEHPLPEPPKKAKDAFRAFQRKARTNFCGMVVNADVHRLRVIGVNDGDGNEVTDAWGWWQTNRLDSKQKQLYRVALSQSTAYTITGPHPKDPTQPLITVEHPREVIVETDPATGDRIAALKYYYDDIDKVCRATVYTENLRTRYVTEERGPGWPPWTAEAWSVVEEIGHDLGVPVVEFSNPCNLGEEPVAAFDAGTAIQDRINLGVFDRMTAARYSAFRQKYVTGHKFKKTSDPMSGLEVVEQPFVPGPDNIWASEGENTRFGEFSQTDIGMYLKGHESDIRDFLVITSTPAYYVATQIINIATDSIMALDANHIAKVREEQDTWGEGWEETLGLASRVAGTDIDFTAAEVRWADPRSLNPAVMADRATKLRSIGYPLAMVAEDLGESPQRVSRLRGEAATDALLASLAQPAAPEPPSAPVPQPEPVNDGAA